MGISIDRAIREDPGKGTALPTLSTHTPRHTHTPHDPNSHAADPGLHSPRSALSLPPQRLRKTAWAGLRHA